MKHYVYIVRAGAYIKIGYSQNMTKRLETMQTGNPHKLKTEALLPFQTEHAARDYERLLHNRCNRYHFRGEWFTDGCMRLIRAAPRNSKSKKSDLTKPTHDDMRWQQPGATQ